MSVDPVVDPVVVPDVKPDPVNVDDKNDPRNNPLYGRVSDLSAKNKDLAAKVEKFEADQKAKLDADLVAKGEFETVQANMQLEIDKYDPWVSPLFSRATG